jgi:hypothetical protein
MKALARAFLDWLTRQIREETCRYFHQRHWKKDYYMGLYYNAHCEKCGLYWTGWDDAI